MSRHTKQQELKFKALREKAKRQRREEALSALMKIANRRANAFVFEDSARMVKHIWSIVGEALTQDRRKEGRDYRILIDDMRTHHLAAETLGIPKAAIEADPNIAKVVVKRMKLIRQPAGVELKTAKQKRTTLGYIDVVFTAQGFEMFATKKKNGAFERNKKPFLTSQNIDSLRTDDFPLSVLYHRLNKLIEYRTNG